MALISEVGFTGKTLLEYKEEIENAYKLIDPNWDISPTSFDGEQTAILSEMFANLDELIGLAYAACDPSSAVGQSMLNIADISGVERDPAEPSTAIVQITGDAGVTVPNGVEIKNESTNTLWTTDESIILSGLIDEVGVTCKTVGPEPASAGDLNKFNRPLAGVHSVTNPLAAVIGKNEETINELRIKRAQTVARIGSNQVDNMRSELLDTDQVRHCVIFENDEADTDDKGVFGHSLMVIVDGGQTEAIAKSIARKKNAGCGLNKDNDVIPNRVFIDTTTAGGSPFPCTFFRAQPVLVTVIVTLSQKANLPVNYEQDIKYKILEFATGSIFVGEEVVGFDRTGYTIGEYVTAFGLVVPVAKVMGSSADVMSITVNGADKVEVEFNEIAQFSHERIIVQLDEDD